MDYKEKFGYGYYKDIIDCIQDRVNEIVKNVYEGDECFPEYRVGILYENSENQKITLTCTHSGSTFSRTLFAREESYYGYAELGDIVQDLYNQTM